MYSGFQYRRDTLHLNKKKYRRNTFNFLSSFYRNNEIDQELENLVRRIKQIESRMDFLNEMMIKSFTHKDKTMLTRYWRKSGNNGTMSINQLNLINCSIIQQWRRHLEELKADRNEMIVKGACNNRPRPSVILC